MYATNCLDLAATCAELIGTAGSSAVKLNQLSRVYRDVPPELRELQGSIANSKQTLDRLLPLLDRDQPAFQHSNDVEALDLHFKAIAFVIKGVQEHIAQVEQARSTPFPDWASVEKLWDERDFAESAARLRRQVSGLQVYLKVSRPETEVEKLVEITDPDDRTHLITAWDDAADYAAPVPAPATQAALHAVPAVSIGEAQSPKTDYSDDISSGAENSQHLANSPLTYYSSTASHAGSSKSVTTNYATLSHLVLPTTPSQMDLVQPRRNGYWRDAIKSQNMSMPSARKLKSMAMLQKPPVEPAPMQGLTTQAEQVNPAEFKDRVSGYARGISPIWELRTVPARKKESKQRYRNRFTRNPEDDLSPDKIQSQFKVTEKQLWEAILHRELEKVSKIMEHRWSDNIIVEKRDRLTALHLAASLGLCSIVQKLVSLGANPNHTDRYGATALHYAADFGCASCINILAVANGGLELESPKTHVKTPLYYAAKRGNVEATHTLLSLGAHVYTLNTTPQETILYAAVESGNIDVCKAILNKGGNPGESFDTLSLAAATSREIMSLLAGSGANLNVHDSKHETLLQKYIAKGDSEMVTFLLILGTDSSSSVDSLGRMPLHLALHKGGSPESSALVKALLDAGNSPDAKNSLGQTPLHLAALWGRADVADILCRAGANMYIGDSKGVTAYEETQLPGYASRVGSSTLANFPGTKGILERWQ
jgi:ankyrin repeat protein